MAGKHVILARDVEASVIPYGDKITLAGGTPVTISQSLGGSFTVISLQGYMVRIEGKDADALGEEPPPPPDPVEQAKKSVTELVWDQLRTCYDPEIPVNIVDLGLVYACEVTPRPEGGDKASVKFTLTAPGCGMGDVLKQDIERKVLTVPGVQEVIAEIAFEPAWDQNRMTDAAKLQLGLM